MQTQESNNLLKNNFFIKSNVLKEYFIFCPFHYTSDYTTKTQNLTKQLLHSLISSGETATPTIGRDLRSFKHH